MWHNNLEMAYSEGTILGHYKILSLLGAGGNSRPYSPLSLRTFVGAKKSVDRAVHAISRDGRLRTILRLPVALELHDISREGHVLISRTDQSRRIGGVFGDDPRERDVTVLNWSFPRALSPDGHKLLLVEQGGRPVVNKVCIRKNRWLPCCANR